MNRNRASRAPLVPWIFVLLVLTTVIGSRIVLAGIEQRARVVRDTATAVIYREFGAELSWERITPSLTRGLSVVGVEIAGIGTADRIDIRIRFTDIFRRNIEEAIPEIVVVDPVISIESIESRAAFDHLAATIANRESIAIETTVTIRNGLLRYDDGDATLVFYTIDGTARLSAEEIAVTGRADAGFSTAIADDAFTVGSDVSVDLVGTRSGGSLAGTVDIGEVAGSHVTLERQSAFLSLTDGILSVERIRSRDPLDLSVDIDTLGGNATILVRSDEFRPGDIMDLRGPWSEYRRFLALPITSLGELSFASGSLDSAQGSLTTFLDLEELPEPLYVDAELSYSARRINIDRSVISATRGSATLVGNWQIGDLVPSGIVDLRAFAYAGAPALSGRLSLRGGPNSARIAASRLSFETIDLADIEASFTRDDRFSSIRVSGTDGADGRFRGRFRLSSRDELSGELTLDDFSVGTLIDLSETGGFAVSTPPQIDRFTLDGAFRLDRRNGAATIRVPNLALSDPESDFRARVGGTYREGAVIVDRYFVSGGGITVLGEALIAFASGGTVDFDTALTVNRVPYSFRGIVDRRGNITVSGPYGVEVRVTRTAAGGLALQGVIDDLPLPLGRTTLSTRIDGLFLGEDDWYIALSDVLFEDVPAPGGTTGSIAMSATVRPGAIGIALLEAGDYLGGLAGTIEAEYRLGLRPEVNLEGRFGSFEGNEQYRIQARYADDRFAVDTRFLNTPVSRLQPQIRDGTISGAIQAAGTFADPQLRAFIETSDVRSGGREIGVRLFAFGDRTELRVFSSELSFGSLRFSVEEVAIDRTDGSIGGSIVFDDEDREQTDQITLIGATDPLPNLSTALLRSVPVRAQLATAPVESDRPEHIISFERDNGVTTVRRGDAAFEVRIEDEGPFSVATAAPLPIVMQAEGLISAGEIELTASGVEVDLSGVTGAIAIPGVEEISGVASGAIRVIGRPGDPRFYGTLRIEDFSASTSFSPQPIGPIETAVILEENLVRLRPSTVLVNGSTVQLDGEILLNRLNPEAFRFGVTIDGDTGVPISRQFGPINVDGFGLGRLEIEGTRSQVTISGDIRANSTRLTLADDFERRERDTNLFVDLNLVTGRAVQFIWPDSDFPILRASFVTDQQISLQSNTLDRTFEIQGEAGIQSGDIFYFDRSFILRDGAIVFRENEERFDPRISVRAELREATPDGPVRIFLIADNQALTEFSPRFESNPPLPGIDIIAILGGNIYRQGDEAINVSTALLSTSDFVTQFGLFRGFEDSIRDQFNLDLFAIRTSLIQNALLTAIDPADEDAQEITPSLGTYLNNTSIFMGRYLGDAVFGQVLLELRSQDFEEENQDEDGFQELGGVLIDSEISLEWQTPFFLLEWAIAPQNPEELFVRDNTFSFLWSFRY